MVFSNTDLKERLLASGISARTLARRTGMSDSYLSKFLSGSRELPVSAVASLREALRELEELLAVSQSQIGCRPDFTDEAGVANALDLLRARREEIDRQAWLAAHRRVEPATA